MAPLAAKGTLASSVPVLRASPPGGRPGPAFRSSIPVRIIAASTWHDKIDDELRVAVGSIKGHDGTWPGLIDFCGSCAWKCIDGD